MSQSAATILEEIGGYHLTFRGMTELKVRNSYYTQSKFMLSLCIKKNSNKINKKGKGTHKTFWLTGKDNFHKELPAPVSSENNHG